MSNVTLYSAITRQDLEALMTNRAIDSYERLPSGKTVTTSPRSQFGETAKRDGETATEKEKGTLGKAGKQGNANPVNCVVSKS